MLGQEIKLLITDFDGTLVDTFSANYTAYAKAFADKGLNLKEDDYRWCFGLRYEKFMEKLGITDEALIYSIKELKKIYYPECFYRFKVNRTLLNLMRTFRKSGGKTALASTARRYNLVNALEYIGASNDFDLILAGEEVIHGKPSPEIYLSVLKYFNLSPSEALVFEDSDVGVKAAEAACINYIIVNRNYYGD